MDKRALPPASPRYSGATIKSGYEPHIDGLRAVAVLPVIAFHSGVPGFAGGFVGVDIFFVISGFLITRLILEQTQAGRFSFGQFYYRRFRRLFPALLVTVCGSLIAGYFLFGPMEFKRLGGSAFHALVSVSNFFFWGESGYFDAASATKPLLHTWSLSVEEQFYLVWPALIVFVIAPMGAIGRSIVLCVIAAASAVACVHFVSIDQAATYFLMPFRMYEFAVGASIILWQRLPVASALRGAPGFLAGILLVAYSVVSFKETMPFPYLWAAIPSIGAALLIGSTSRWRKILELPLLVYIGRVSYSLYLVHWPVWVFYGAMNIAAPTPIEQATLLGVTFVVSAALFHLIEDPLRRGRIRSFVLPYPAVGALGGAGLIIALTFSSHLWASNGLPQRFPAAVQETGAAIWGEVARLRNEASLRRSGDYIVFIGDSTSGNVYESFLLSDQNGKMSSSRHKQFTLGNCNPLDYEIGGAWDLAVDERCASFMKNAFRWIESNDPAYIVISSRFGLESREMKAKALCQTVEHLLEKTKATILLMDMRVEYRKSPARFAHIAPLMGEKSFNAKFEQLRSLANQRSYGRVLEDIAASNQRLSMLRSRRHFCGPRDVCAAMKDGHILYRDGIHLSGFGVKLHARAIDRAFRDLSNLPRNGLAPAASSR